MLYKETLKKLLYKAQVSPQYSLYEFIRTKWTSKGDRQYAQSPDISPYLNKLKQHMLSQLEVFLYYARAFDCTMLPTSNQMTVQQA